MQQQHSLTAVLFLFACSYLLLASASARDIELSNEAKYGNILVAIGEDVVENQGLVDRIKAVFSSASRRLLLATQFNRDYSLAFGDVRILLPQSWNNSQTDAVATWEAQDTGHFRVGNASGTAAGTEPSTVQPGGCGQHGLFVKLDAGYLMGNDAETVGKQLVAEFAKLRYGVFNEYNAGSGPHAYLQRGRITPIGCSRSLRGKFANKESGGPCRVDRDTLELEPDCRFVPDAEQSAQASLTYATYLDNVNQFCDKDASNLDLDHHSEAPNPHNRRCRNRSVRDVMRLHPDLRRSIRVDETDPTVNFTVLRQRPARTVVLVMDISGSMQGQPIAKLKIACKALIKTHLEDNVNCGLITFNAQVQRIREVASLNSSDIRDDFWRAVRRLQARGNTAIGDALAVGMEMLGANLRNLSKLDTGYIVLLSDGKENTHTRYKFAQAIALVKRTSIIVDTIAFGNNADKRLADLSRDTGGKSYFARFTSPANDLLEAMADLVRDRVTTAQKPIDIFSAPVSSGFTELVQIDQSVAKSATFSLSSTTPLEITRANLVLRSPLGNIYSERNSSVFDRDNENGIITITLSDNIEAGTWTVSETATASPNKRQKRSEDSPMAASLSLTISTKPADAAPIILDGLVSVERVNLTADTEIAVYATLAKGSELTLGANVSASVESDLGVGAEFVLLDNGAGADTNQNDGVYSGFVPSSITGLQEYNVRIKCDSPVLRVSTAGKFEIVEVDSGSLGRIAPGTVEDLRAEVQLKAANVSLIWTAVGDKRMDGTPSQYKIFACPTLEQLTNSSNSRNNCQLNISITPLPAGSEHRTQVSQQQLGNPQSTIFIGLFAQNAAGIEGELSNSVSVQFRLPDNIDEIETPNEEGSFPIAIVLGAVAGAVVVLALIALVIYRFIYKR